MEKFILLGASRGLGWQTYLHLRSQKPQGQFLLSSRKISARRPELNNNTMYLEQDFSSGGVCPEFSHQLQKFGGECLIYFAGGGPYGLFHEKKWQSHQWAIRTSFLYPAELLHSILQNPSQWPDLKKIVLIGSSVAEAAADPGAASYAAAKHALRGLVDTIRAEQKPVPEVLLFSPGYMQTDLLPSHSEPRLSHRAENPSIVAERLIEYIENDRR